MKVDYPHGGGTYTYPARHTEARPETRFDHTRTIGQRETIQPYVRNSRSGAGEEEVDHCPIDTQRAPASTEYLKNILPTDRADRVDLIRIGDTRDLPRS
ncbi:hypothetical protein GCM10023259_096260 [Thermocatellispora tengchongensis]